MGLHVYALSCLHTAIPVHSSTFGTVIPTSLYIFTLYLLVCMLLRVVQWHIINRVIVLVHFFQALASDHRQPLLSNIRS